MKAGLALFASLLCATSSLALSPASAGAAELDELITLSPGGGNSRPYTLAPDGTFWNLTSCGSSCFDINHFSGAGTNLGGAVRINRSICPANSGLAIVGVRAYLTNSCTSIGAAQLSSYVIDGSIEGANPGEVFSGINMNRRIDGGVRALGGALAFAGVGNVTLATASTAFAPAFYPQTTMGWGVNTNPCCGQGVFESCRLNDANDEDCQYSGRGGPELGKLNDPRDVAGTATLLYVVEGNSVGQGDLGERVTVLEQDTQGGPSGWQPTFTFGNGSQGDLDGPISIVRNPANRNVFVSDAGHRRISEFNAAGFRLRSFGYGVSTGANEFETCEPSVSPGCRAGVPFATNSRSYFGHLDFGDDGRLYAQLPVLEQAEGGTRIQAIDVGSTGPVAKSVDLGAKPLKVKKNKKTTLTATLSPCADSGEDRALFQVKKSGGFDNLGGAKAVDGACKAKTKVKIRKKSVFRALSIGPSEETLATSPKLTVTVKK
jgi:hypothetical protein